MARTERSPHPSLVTDTVLAELTHAYLRLRKTYAEGLTQAATEAELGRWQDRTTGMKRYWELLNQQDLGEVLDGVAAVHAAQQTANTYIAAQIAATQSRPVAP